MGRQYTVQEVAELRQVVTDKYLWGRYQPAREAGLSRCYKAEELTAHVEEQVRTHMLAGHTAQDLILSEGGDPNIVSMTIYGRPT